MRIAFIFSSDAWQENVLVPRSILYYYCFKQVKKLPVSKLQVSWKGTTNKHDIHFGKRHKESVFLLMQYIQVPFVLACLDGLLGSPVPMVLLARTRNSYSTQGLRSITVAVSRWPPTTSGTGIKQTVPPSVSRNFVCVCVFYMCVC